MTGRSVVWPVAIIIAAVAAATLVFWASGAAARPYVVLAFALVCPGLAVVRLIGIGDPLLEVAAGVALSIAAEVLASVAMVYAGVWSATTLFASLVAVAIAGAGLELAGVGPEAESLP